MVLLHKFKEERKEDKQEKLYDVLCNDIRKKSERCIQLCNECSYVGQYKSH